MADASGNAARRRGVPRSVVWLMPLAAAGMAAVLLAMPSASRPRGGLEELGRAGIERRIAPRLSFEVRYRPCTERLPPGGIVPRESCGAGGRLSRSLSRLVARVSSAARHRDAEAVHAAAAVDLLWADSAGPVVDRSVSTLRSAAQANRSPRLLSDLAAAHLVRGSRRQSMRDLVMALEAAEQAVERAPRYAPALFNRALALEWLNLVDQARDGWLAYLAVDSTSGWAAEAARRERSLGWEPPPPPPDSAASASEVDGYVRAHPQQSRTYGWESVLGWWGDAVLAGDAARASRMLALASALGEALERRGGDATLADAVRAIRGARGGALLSLARDHRAYAAGRAAYDRVRYPTALDSFSRVLRRPAAPSPLYGWARVFQAGAVGYVAPAAADTLARGALQGVLASPRRARYGALEGRARWILGTLLLRQGDYPAALAEFRGVEARFARVGEEENAGAAVYLQGETLSRQGETEASYAAYQRAGLALRPYRGSVWLHNLLHVEAEAASADGTPRAAQRLIDEDVAVSGRTVHPVYLVEAGLSRARLLAAAGDTARMEPALAAARRSVARLDSGYVRQWFTAELRLVAASADVHSEPARTRAQLDSVVAFWRGRNNTTHQIPAFLSHARAALTFGEVATARSDLAQAVAMVEREVAAEPRAAARARLLDATHVVFDQMVKLSLQRADTAGALAVLERGRPSYTSAREAGGVVPVVAGEVAVSYALVGDVLCVWTVSERGIGMDAAAVPPRLLPAIRQVRAALERGDDGPVVRAELAWLYERLVRPVERRLGPSGGVVVIVADGELAGVPFAALRDARRGRYLVEDHPLRMAASLRDAAAPRARPGTARPALLVADPAFDARGFPGFGRLPGAAAEVRNLGALYPEAPVLAGPAASRAAVVAALRGAGLLHYAGHAVADDARPDESFLLLAAAPGSPERLPAGEIERLDLRGVRLVVLSACQTLRGGAGRASGLAGLSGAFLAAGAGGVVGSLWPVDDRQTVPLMTAFHREYRASGDAARALGAAQLELLRSSDPALRTPAAWAVFRYAGH